MTKLTNPETETQEAIGIASETPETPLPDFELETFFVHLRPVRWIGR